MTRRTEHAQAVARADAAVLVSQLAQRALELVDEFGDEETFPSEEELSARKEEFLDRLLALEGLPPTDRDFAWSAVSSAISWHRDRYDRFAAELRTAERRRQELLEQLSPIYAEALDKTVIALDMASKLNGLLVAYDRLPPLLDTRPLDPPLVEMLGDLRALREEMAPLVRAHDEQQREAQRAERIAAHRTPDVVMPGTICSNCGKKPARVDDLCKVCARAAGTLPHGKII